VYASMCDCRSYKKICAFGSLVMDVKRPLGINGTSSGLMHARNQPLVSCITPQISNRSKHMDFNPGGRNPPGYGMGVAGSPRNIIHYIL